MHNIDQQRLLQFEHALEQLQTQAGADLGARDTAHLERVRTISRRLELLGRALLHFSFEPVGFSAGVTSLWAHKCLERMEIDHAASAAQSEAHTSVPSWGASARSLDWSALLASVQVQVRETVRLFEQHAGGRERAAGATRKQTALHHRAHETALGYLAKAVLLVPPLTRPFFWKVALGTLLAEAGRDVLLIAMTRAGRVEAASDDPKSPACLSCVSRAASARDIELPKALSILCGALDKRVEHHLFPHLPPQRLRELAPRVRALCAEFGVVHRNVTLTEALRALLVGG